MSANAQCPLMLDSWLEYNRIKWGVRIKHIKLSTGISESPSIEAKLFLNSKGKLCLPQGNPYSGVSFVAPENARVSRLTSQWIELANRFIEETAGFGIAYAMVLPPEITDVRPWQWAGFKVSVKYTYYIDYPFDLSDVGKALRRKIREASKDGYYCTRTNNIKDAYDCLKATEERQGFEHKLLLNDLETAQKLIGEDNYRIYVCYSASGEPVSTSIELFALGSRTLGLMAGTKMAHLKSNVASMLHGYILDDLQSAGSSGYDFVGANIPSVAQSKSHWKCRLVPYYVVEPYSAKHLVAWVKNWRGFSESKWGNK